MAGSYSSLRKDWRLLLCISRFRQEGWVLVSLLFVLLVTPLANADAIYTFFDKTNNITLQFTAPYIVTPSTPPLPITSFLIAPAGFLPCTLQIFDGLTAGNTLGCTATGMVAGVTKTWHEIWIIMNNVPFPTSPGSFTLPYGDLAWDFSGDIPVYAGNITLTVTQTPEPVSMTLLVIGMAALGLRRAATHFRRGRQKSV